MIIIGRLTRDAVVRTIRDQHHVVNFSIAVDESYRKKNGERVKRAAFFDCSYWRTVNIAPLLTKGTLVELTGSTSARVWHDKDGEAHASLNFRTDQIKFHGGSLKPRGEREQQVVFIPQPVEDDIPF